MIKSPSISRCLMYYVLSHAQPKRERESLANVPTLAAMVAANTTADTVPEQYRQREKLVNWMDTAAGKENGLTACRSDYSNGNTANMRESR
ncbi:hypothetical protein [Pantoea dispersa]|uniref:hypothetical protein n=1 Tax=Pantoea dispersa TaxID=59814 RepID=UPI00226A0C9C|nr:hypothetical protein [Pantoea dispersa]